MRLGRAYGDGEGFPCGIKMLIVISGTISRSELLVHCWIKYLLHLFFPYIFGAIQFLDLYSATYRCNFVDYVVHFNSFYYMYDICSSANANNKLRRDFSTLLPWSCDVWLRSFSSESTSTLPGLLHFDFWYSSLLFHPSTIPWMTTRPNDTFLIGTKAMFRTGYQALAIRSMTAK